MLMCCLCSIGFQLSACQPPYYQIGWQFNEPPPAPPCMVAGNTWLKLRPLPYCRPLERLHASHKNQSLVRPPLLTSVTCCSPDSLCLGRATACQFFLPSHPPSFFVLLSNIFFVFPSAETCHVLEMLGISQLVDQPPPSHFTQSRCSQLCLSFKSAGKSAIHTALLLIQACINKMPHWYINLLCPGCNNERVPPSGGCQSAKRQ